MKNKIIISIFIIGLLSIIGNIFYNPTSTTIVESNKHMIPASPDFDDDNFYKCITNTLRVSEDTNVTDEQLASITNLDCDNVGISSTKGIEKLTGVKTIRLPNNSIKAIDLSNNLLLQTLYLQSNQITDIDVSSNLSLSLINISDNYIPNIDVSNNSRLTDLFVDKDVNVTGAGARTNVSYLEVPYLFDSNKTRFKSEEYEYSIDISDTVTKLSFCNNYINDTMLCSSKINDLISQAREVYYNGELFDYQNFMMDIQNKMMERQDEYFDYIIKSNSGENTVFEIEFDNNVYYMEYKDGESIQYNTLFDLTEDENTLRIIMNNDAEYILHMNRKIDGQDGTEASEELDDILEEVVDTSNKENDIIKEGPGTGMFTAILLSMLSIGVVALLYFRYYKVKIKD